jgi:hypothetical protein
MESHKGAFSLISAGMTCRYADRQNPFKTVARVFELAHALHLASEQPGGVNNKLPIAARVLLALILAYLIYSINPCRSSLLKFES